MPTEDFGYPRACERCRDLSEAQIGLTARPFYQAGPGAEAGGRRLMLIGQDPTIVKDAQRVRAVLMLDDPKSQLRRWLEDLLGIGTFATLTIYATNVVKCSLQIPPSRRPEGALNYLTPFFANCKDYLRQELLAFQPDLVLAFGASAHQLFLGLLEGTVPPARMREAFGAKLYSVSVGGLVFKYAPCLHITTFRVAQGYGDAVREFRRTILAWGDA
jgi:uracil-DNA glycosylase